MLHTHMKTIPWEREAQQELQYPNCSKVLGRSGRVSFSSDHILWVARLQSKVGTEYLVRVTKFLTKNAPKCS